MSYNSTTSAPPPRASISVGAPTATTQVETQLVDLEHRSDALLKIISDLEDHLNNTLRPPVSDDGPQKDAEVILVPTAARLRKVSGNVQSAFLQIESILSRLEL